MNKDELERDILHLKYQFQIEKVRASLTILTIGVLSFLGTFIWHLDRLAFGIAISAIIIIISIIFYKESKSQLQSIVKDLRKLSISKRKE